MNRNSILLIIIGVIGLGISLFVIAGFVVVAMSPGSRDNLEDIRGLSNIAGWSSIVSAAMIVWGIGSTIYDNWRR